MNFSASTSRKYPYSLCLLVIVVIAGHMLLICKSQVKTMRIQSSTDKRLIIHALMAEPVTPNINSAKSQVTGIIDVTPAKIPPQASVTNPKIIAPVQARTSSPTASEKKIEIEASTRGWIEAQASEYFRRDEVDIAAEPLTDIGIQFARLFPVLSGIVVVEFWIDFSGKVTKVDIQQGRTLVPIDTALETLLDTEFLPAQRAGEPVSSRKLIEVDTNIVFQ
jgi:hypothetical protein